MTSSPRPAKVISYPCGRTKVMPRGVLVQPAVSLCGGRCRVITHPRVTRTQADDLRPCRILPSAKRTGPVGALNRTEPQDSSAGDIPEEVSLHRTRRPGAARHRVLRFALIKFRPMTLPVTLVPDQCCMIGAGALDEVPLTATMGEAG